MPRETLDRLLSDLREANAIQAAIEYGELLAALPSSPDDRRRHNVAVSLLERQRAVLARSLMRCEQIIAERENQDA